MIDFTTIPKQVFRFCKNSNGILPSWAYYLVLNTLEPVSYIPFSQELLDVHAWIKEMPKDFDIVVGIPRHGLLHANLIASLLGKPLSTPDMVILNKYWMSGQSGWRDPTKNARLLLVDESTQTGAAMRSAYTQIRDRFPYTIIRCAATYATPNCVPHLYSYYQVLSHGHDYELNLVHGGTGRKPLGVDLDGVLCRNYRDGHYLNHVKNAIRYRVPHTDIDFIVTGRHEKFRSDTENWLLLNGVKYKDLFMWGGNGSHAAFKAAIVRREKPRVFIESNPEQARMIHLLSGCRVICIDSPYMYGGS